MSDSSLPFILAFGTTADRTAFTPTPGSAQQLYIWLDSDDQPNSYYWDGAAWQVLFSPSGSGDVVGPASSVDEQIAVFDGITGKLIKDGGITIADLIAMIPAAAITQLTGDVTAGPGSGSQAATIANLAVTTGKIANTAVTDAKLATDSVITAKILNANVTYAKIQNVADARLLGNFTGAPAAVSEYSLGAGVEQNSGAIRTKQAIRTTTIGITVDGGGSVITAGMKGFRSFPVAATIIAWRLLADVAGDVEFDIFKDPFASYPPTTSIVAAAPPELSGVDSDEDSTLTGWTTSVSAGDVFGFEVVGSPATITRVTLELTIVVTG